MSTITLCGSTRFADTYRLWNKALSLAGHEVFSCAQLPGDPGVEKDWYTSDQKEILDRVHKRKIQKSDAALFLNVDGYLGESSLSELTHARELGVRVFMLESWGKGCGRNGYASPIVATWGPYSCPFDLFGPAGALRSQLVELVGVK